MKKIFLILLVAFGCSFSAPLLHCQEIKCDVLVNMEQVDYENRNYLNSFERDLESYINNQRFTDLDWEGDPIPVNIQVVLSGGSKGIFNARVMINSQRVLDGPDDVPATSPAFSIYDDTWKFEYNNGANLTYNPMRYNEFTSLIDYYMLMIIGTDLDSYESNGGSEIFNKARNLAVQCATAGAPGFETNRQQSEMNKYNLVNEITDARYEEIRRLIFAYYVNGMDVIGFDKAKGIEALKGVLLDMANFKQHRLINHSLLLQMFFEAKYREIAAIFNGYKDDSFFEQLMQLDPSNSLTYTQAKDGTYVK